MRPPGSYKLHGSARRPRPDPLDPVTLSYGRGQRIVDSLRAEILNAEQTQWLRIRQVGDNPQEIFRVELEVPELSYLRTTLLDRDALEELLEEDEVRAIVLDQLD